MATTWLPFMATAVTICSDFGAPPKIKSDTVSTVSPSISHEVMALSFSKNLGWVTSQHCLLHLPVIPSWLEEAGYAGSSLAVFLIFKAEVAMLLVLWGEWTPPPPPPHPPPPTPYSHSLCSWSLKFPFSFFWSLQDMPKEKKKANSL